MRIIYMLLLAFWLAAVTACDRGTPPPAATSTSQAASSADTSGPRIVSAVPAATLQIVQLGGADVLVGVTPFDRDFLPPEKFNLPAVGDYFNMNYEALLRLQPTALIVQFANDRLAPELRTFSEQHHVELVNIRLDTIDDLCATAERLGKLCGKEQTARFKTALLRTQIAALKARVAALPHPKVLYLIGINPIFVVGGHRFMDDMVTLAGGTNVGALLNKDFPEINREGILRLAPEVMLIAAPGQPAAADFDDPRLKLWMDLSIPAARNGRVYLVTNPNSQLASFDFPQEALELAQMIHPELKSWSLPTEILEPATNPATQPAGGTP